MLKRGWLSFLKARRFVARVTDQIHIPRTKECHCYSVLSTERHVSKPLKSVKVNSARQTKESILHTNSHFKTQPNFHKFLICSKI